MHRVSPPRSQNRCKAAVGVPTRDEGSRTIGERDGVAREVLSLFKIGLEKSERFGTRWPPTRSGSDVVRVRHVA